MGTFTGNRNRQRARISQSFEIFRKALPHPTHSNIWIQLARERASRAIALRSARSTLQGLRRQREQMVEYSIFSLLGRESHDSQTNGLFTVFWSYRNPTFITSRYRRGKLSLTRARFAVIKHRTDRATRNYLAKKKVSARAASRQSLSRSHSGRDSL